MAERDAVDGIVDQWARIRPELDTQPMALLGRVFRISDLVGAQMERAYTQVGLSRGEFDVLATLRRAGGDTGTLSPGNLASALMVTSGGITGRLDKLESARLLVRSPDPDDRRALRVTLTDAGKELVDRAVSVGLDVQHEVVSSAGLSAREVSTLNNLLRRLHLGVSPGV